jgi:hypothetical protein
MCDIVVRPVGAGERCYRTGTFIPGVVLFDMGSRNPPSTGSQPRSARFALRRSPMSLAYLNVSQAYTLIVPTLEGFERTSVMTMIHKVCV